MIRVGLTGGIASGKSTVSAYLRQLGACVIDADEIAKAVTSSGTEGLQAVVEAFGSDLLTESGSLDRKELARRVFASEALRERLNAIVHPRVARRMEEEEAMARTRGEPAVVLDVPLLFEAGMDRMVDEVWLVAIPPEVQVSRMRARNGYDEAEAWARVMSQWPLADKLARADVVICNDGPWEETARRVRDLWARRIQARSDDE